MYTRANKWDKAHKVAVTYMSEDKVRPPPGSPPLPPLPPRPPRPRPKIHRTESPQPFPPPRPRRAAAAACAGVRR